VITCPILLLRAEGGIEFALSLLVYGELKASWILFGLLILAPDLSIFTAIP